MGWGWGWTWPWFGLASSVPSSHRNDGVGEFRDMWGGLCGVWCCLHDDDAGGGARGRRLSLARVTATTTLGEARADVGSTGLRDGDNDAGGGARGRRLSLARVKATMTLAEARADVGSHLLA